MGWLVTSVVLSIVLTVVLNVLVRISPRARDGFAMRPIDERPRSSVRVYAPWKAMLLVSLVLTVVVNAALWFLR